MEENNEKGKNTAFVGDDGENEAFTLFINNRTDFKGHQRKSRESEKVTVAKRVGRYIRQIDQMEPFSTAQCLHFKFIKVRSEI